MNGGVVYLKTKLNLFSIRADEGRKERARLWAVSGGGGRGWRYLPSAQIKMVSGLNYCNK